MDIKSALPDTQVPISQLNTKIVIFNFMNTIPEQTDIHIMLS